MVNEIEMRIKTKLARIEGFLEGAKLRFDENEPRDAHGEWTSGGEGKDEKEQKEGKEAAEIKPNLSSDEQDFVDNFDEDDPESWVLGGGANPAPEGSEYGTLEEHLLGMKDAADNFDESDPDSWKELGASDDEIESAKSAQERIDNFDKSDPATWGEQTETVKLGDKEYPATKAEVASSELEDFEPDNPSTWSLSHDKESDLQSKQDDVDGQDHKEPDGWEIANDSRISELGKQYDQIENDDEAEKFAKDHQPEVKERLASMKQELKEAMVNSKLALKKTIAEEKQKGIAQNDADEKSVEEITAKYQAAADKATEDYEKAQGEALDKWIALNEKDNGERD